jgi:hypothetical protein
MSDEGQAAMPDPPQQLAPVEKPVSVDWVTSMLIIKELRMEIIAYNYEMISDEIWFPHSPPRIIFVPLLSCAY